MELAIADGDLMGEDRAVIGAEVVKVYTSARFDDILHLDWSALKPQEIYWGGEEAFNQTKMTGAGCAIEVLPCWMVLQQG